MCLISVLTRLKLSSLPPPNSSTLDSDSAPTSASPLPADDVGLKSGAPATQKARFGQNRAVGGVRVENVDGVTGLLCAGRREVMRGAFLAGLQRILPHVVPPLLTHHKVHLMPNTSLIFCHFSLRHVRVDMRRYEAHECTTLRGVCCPLT